MNKENLHKIVEEQQRIHINFKKYKFSKKQDFFKSSNPFGNVTYEK